MKEHLLKSYLFLLISLFIVNESFAGPVKKGKAPVKKVALKKHQPKKVRPISGSVYVVATKSRIPVGYTRSYSKKGKYTYVTQYNIYDQKNRSIRNVVAVHNKKDHSIEVTVKDMERPGFPVINIERTKYSTAYMGRFGSYGKVGAIGQGKAGTTSVAPGQLTLKFLSKRFDYVKVVHIAGSHEDTGTDLQVYILDEQAQ